MKRILILFIILLCLTSSCQISNKISPELVNKIDKGVGVLGPIILDFDNPIQNSFIEKAIRTIPAVNLRFQWQGSRLNIFPEMFFSFNQEYQIFYKKSVLSQNEKLAQSEYSWKIKTHPVCLIYIGSATELPEIWKVCMDNNLKTQLSRSKGKIVDFDISNDGNWIVYSAKNILGGSDIWLMDINGMDNHVFYKCDEDFCSEPKFSPDGMSIMFIRNNKNHENKAVDKNEEVLIRNFTTGEESKLLTNKRLKVTFLQWSADQKYISFFDGFSSSFWIWNLSSNQISELPSGEGLGGSWKRDESSFIFAGINYWGGVPYGQINQWDEKTNSIQRLFGDENDPNEYFSPKWRPQGDWIAAAFRPIQGSASKQVALFSVDGKQQMIVTNEQAFSYSSFSWSCDGEMIAFQMFQIGVSGLVPEIGLWRMSDQSKLIIEKNASSPKWIP